MSEIIILANSRKYHGRCVAGIDLKTGKWVRPISISDHEEVPESVAAEFYEIISNNRDNIKGILVGHGHFWIEDTIFDKIPVVMTAAIGEPGLLSGKEPHTILEGKADSSLNIKTRKDL